MPTYSYECRKCGHQFEEFHGMNETPKIKCEKCNSAQTQKLIGTGSGIIFKGSGFYETDFKDKKGTPPKKSGKKTEKAKSESKSKPASDSSKKSTTAKSDKK